MAKIVQLRNIAKSIDDHAQNGQPYSLSSYYDHEEPLTKSQKARLETYLAHSFHQIWANTWLHMDSDGIRVAIGDKPIWS